MQWHLQLRYIKSQPSPESAKLNVKAKEEAPFS